MRPLSKVFCSGSRRVADAIARPSSTTNLMSNKREIHDETLERYCPGGYHPVRIGDLFNSGKYKIIRKLGHGLYSTVWLARNNS